MVAGDPRKYRVLIAEDDLALAKALETSFQNEAFEVFRTANGAQCLQLAVKHQPHVILLDQMLEDGSGVGVCRELRRRGLQSIIIFVTVLGQELDKVVGLEVGADDYITKPFSLRELIARARAHLRRQAPASPLAQHLENDLRRAVERGEFRIHYQPIVSLSDNCITGFEALVRWQRPECGLVMPAEFIPAAEETGLIISIGNWVLREACRQMRAWSLQFPADPPLTVAVNISAKQFAQPDLVSQVEQILHETGLAPRSLKLEITESLSMHDAERTAEILGQFKSLGIRSSIDDFGTGYSSLSYLRRFPFDTLKIDRSFVSDIGNNLESRKIVQTIMTLARNLGMEVVAEGTETAEQVNQLRSLGCECAQGYFFSKPLNLEATQKLLTAQPGPKESLPEFQVHLSGA